MCGIGLVRFFCLPATLQPEFRANEREDEPKSQAELSIAMFAVDGTTEGRRACVLMIARSKEHVRGFRTSCYEHTGASGFNRSINGKHGNIIMGHILMIRRKAPIYLQ